MVTQSEESMTLMTSCGVLSIYLITVADPSLAFRMTPYLRRHSDAFRFPSLATFSPNCHSERGKNAVREKTENGTVTRSEESMTLMTLCGFFSVHHKITLTVFPITGNRSFTFVQDDVLP